MCWSLLLQRRAGSRATAACEFGSACKSLSDLTSKEILEASCARFLGFGELLHLLATLHTGYQGSLLKIFVLQNK